MRVTPIFLLTALSITGLFSLSLRPAFAADASPTAPAEEKPQTKSEIPSEPKTQLSEPTFTGTAAEIKKHMDGLFEASKNVNSANAAEKNAARAKIDQATDWDAIAEECLGKAEWKRQSAANRKDFRSLLRDVILRTVYSRMDKFWKGASAGVDKIDVKGGDAKLTAKFHTGAEKMKLDYYFHQKAKKWLLYDVAYNNLRYSVNINDQIDAFLREKKFGELLKSLRKRRDELISDAKSDAR